MKIEYRLDYTDGTFSKDRSLTADSKESFKIKVAKLAPYAITPDVDKIAKSISIKDGKKYTVIWTAQNV